MLTEPLRVLYRVTEALESVDVPYAVGGSIASSIHGEPRSSEDVDILVDLRPDQVQPFIAALRDEFYVDATTIGEALRAGSSFNIIELKSMLKVDCFVASPRILDQRQMSRRCVARLDPDAPRPLFLTTAEDTILRKLDWFRRGDMSSTRQWRDILGVLKVQGPRLDLAYLKETAAAAGIAHLLEKALEESGMAP